MEVDIELEMSQGQIRKVVSINDARQVHARAQDGKFNVFTVGLGDEIPKVGDVILLNDHSYRLAPATLWPAADTLIGVVLKVLEDGRVLVRSSYTPAFIPNSDVAVVEGNTVEYTPEKGVIAILSERPFKRDDHYIIEDFEIDSYRISDSDKKLTFADFGGYPEIVKRAQELIKTQIENRNLLQKIGATPIKGVLFTGPPGTGKTFLAKIIAHETDADFFLVSGPEIVGKWVGESEENLRKIFEAAERSPKKRAIIFFDEIDSIAERRTENNHEASRRLVAQFLTLMDGFSNTDASVLVIAATNRADSLDLALTRPGRFDWRIDFTNPNRSDRLEILTAGQRLVTTMGYLPLADIAARTNGWSAADLNALWTEASLVAVSDGRGFIADQDIVSALERVATRRQGKVKDNNNGLK